EPQRRLGLVPVDGLHDRRGRLVPVPARQGEERMQRSRVQRRVRAIAMRRASGGREDAGRLIVPDRLGGEAVRACQVDRTEPTTGLKVTPHITRQTLQKVSIVGSTISLKE